MSIASAVIVSVILCLAVWQIDKRGAWRRVGKGIGYIFGTIVVLSLLIWGGYAARDSWQKRNLVSSLKARGVDTYLGVQLGMGEKEVRYLLGKPDKEDVSEATGTKFLLYYNPRRWVLLMDGAVTTVSCNHNDGGGCPKLMGISLGDSESVVLERLGATSEKPELTDAGAKLMRYGPSKARARFHFEQGLVSSIAVSNERR